MSPDVLIKPRRQLNIDLLRILACFMVVVLHMCGQNFNLIPPKSADWQVINVYYSMISSCVGLFFMISGKLFLQRDRDPDIAKLLKRNVLHLVVVYFLWSFLYAVSQVGLRNIFSDIENLITFTIKSHFHMWFIATLVEIYLLIPILYCLVKYRDGKYVKYFIVMFLLLDIVQKTLLTIPHGSENFNLLISKFSGGFFSSCGYFVYGYYLSTLDLKKIKTGSLLAVFAAAVAIAAAVDGIVSAGTGVQNSFLLDHHTVCSFIESTALFCVFLKLEISPGISEKKEKLIKLLSKCTLGIYLLHPAVIDCLKLKFGIDSLSINPIVSIPLLSVAVFIICLAIIAALNKVPFVNRWFI